MNAIQGTESLRGFYGIVDPYPETTLTHREIAEAFVRAGCPVIQLRIKNHSDAEASRIAREIRGVVPKDRIFLLNDYVDLAVEIDADGAHIGQDDMPASEARTKLGANRILGLSTHNLRQVRLAQNEPVDYIGFGPIFPTRSKPDPDPPTGIEGLREALGTSAKPIVAIGGITLENLDSVLAARPAMVCTIAGVIRKGDIEGSARDWIRRCRR